VLVELKMEQLPDDEFRADLRAWLAEHPPPRIDVVATREDAERLREWQQILYEDRWIGIHWPIEYGGRGASVTQVAVYNEELARAGAPAIIGRVGVTLVGPTLLVHGTSEQRARWMPRILSGEDIWCQLFSEPDAGSDLTSLSTRAVRNGDFYRVTGQKVWSSHATFADMGVALVRTDPDAAPHKGISMLAIPMNKPGVDVRPLRQMTGDYEFNEVFLDDVAVPVDHLIGPEHQGWRVASTTLANERSASFIWREQVRHELAMEALSRTCAHGALTSDPLVRQRLVRSWIDVQILRLHNTRTLHRLACGEAIGSESSVIKLFWAVMSQRFYETAVDVLGPLAVTTGSGEWMNGLLSSRANSIMGGTSEIQRNIIGENLLGLPREPRV
jgi:alkylation response protein AidB-like acyl-CoA dehydrogenase